MGKIKGLGSARCRYIFGLNANSRNRTYFFFYFLHSRTIAYIFVHFPLDPMVAHDQTSLHNTKVR